MYNAALVKKDDRSMNVRLECNRHCIIFMHPICVSIQPKHLTKLDNTLQFTGIDARLHS
jgi:hypothetical protein